MTDCNLQKLDTGKWWCPDCDPDKARLLPIDARRNCILRDRSRDSREMPSAVRQVLSLTKAVAAFVADGCETVTLEEYRSRIEACLHPEGDSEHCENLVDEKRCGKETGCGCYIALKAKGRVWDCPRGKWASPR